MRASRHSPSSASLWLGQLPVVGGCTAFPLRLLFNSSGPNPRVLEISTYWCALQTGQGASAGGGCGGLTLHVGKAAARRGSRGSPPVNRPHPR